MEEDAIKIALYEYYRVATEESRVTGTLRIKMFVSTFTVMAVFITYLGTIITQIDKIVFSFNLITIGLIIIGAAIIMMFVLFIGYLIFLKMLGINIDEIVMNIEKLQRDMLFEKIEEAELKERFQKIYPYLNYYKLVRERKNIKDFFNKYFRLKIE